MTSGQIAYRLSEELFAGLAARAAANASTPTAQAKADLLVLQDLLATELRRFPLTRAEADVLLEIANGTIFGPAIGHLLHGEVSDAFAIAREEDPEDLSYEAQFGVDETRFLKRLAGMSPCADLAVREALVRWWKVGDRSEESYAAAGLRIRGSGPQTS